jgi:hypothetical protein
MFEAMHSTETGTLTMAAILQFEKPTKTERTAFEPGHSATILIYTGVRMERIDFEALREKAREPARVAN